jgi:hypothetical protein
MNWNPIRKMLWTFVAIALFIANIGPLYAQERATNGQIYNDLLPFVDLKGVRTEIRGLEGGIFNVAGGVTGDPETALTGLSRVQHEQLDQAIRTDIAEAFRSAGIPILISSGSANETQPVLSIHINLARMTTDTISIQVKLELKESARLVKDPTTIVWAPTWGTAYNLFSSSSDVAQVIRSTTSNQVAQFVRLYVRAHSNEPDISFPNLKIR